MEDIMEETSQPFVALRCLFDITVSAKHRSVAEVAE